MSVNKVRIPLSGGHVWADDSQPAKRAFFSPGTPPAVETGKPRSSCPICRTETLPCCLTVNKPPGGAKGDELANRWAASKGFCMLLPTCNYGDHKTAEIGVKSLGSRNKNRSTMRGGSQLPLPWRFITGGIVFLVCPGGLFHYWTVDICIVCFIF